LTCRRRALTRVRFARVAFFDLDLADVVARTDAGRLSGQMPGGHTHSIECGL
jgi:hypothetical protein